MFGIVDRPHPASDLHSLPGLFVPSRTGTALFDQTLRTTESAAWKSKHTLYISADATEPADKEVCWGRPA